jgi:hypothetical protein
MPDDILALHEALGSIAAAATSLSWADQRPWTLETHVFWTEAIPTVDLHDLNAKLAKSAVRACCEVPLETGAVFFITGTGRHSVGPGVLGGVVKTELKRACKGRTWRFRPAGPARFVLITDPQRAPSAATGQLGVLFWLFVLLLLAGIASAIWNNLPS